MLPSHPHDEFMRLCALSAAGELTAEEEARLDEHLSECEECSKACGEFDQLVSGVLPVLGAELEAQAEDPVEADDWSVEHAQRKLMEAVDKEASKSKTNGERKKSTKDHLIGIVLMIGSVAAASAFAYHAGFQRALSSSRSVPVASPIQAPPPIAVSTQSAGEEPASQSHQLMELRKQLADGQQRTSELLAELREANSEASRQAETAAQIASERDQARLESSAQQATAHELQARLDVVQQRPLPDAQRIQELEATVKGQTQIIAEKDITIAEQTELLQHDRDIRNLMSARDLYIAEIYDVAKNGTTKKPFGRVFYTRDKSLVFYGFDLDQQPHVTSTSVFQAWGRQDASHDVNLGILYQDDASKNRWVVKFNDAPTLARLDAVFVTVEPKGGSTKPTGKPLLFAYLRLAPNHP